MSNIPYVCLYQSYLEEMEALTDKEVGKLIRCLLRYLVGKPLPKLTRRESLFWPRLRTQHDRDAEHYSKVCKSRSKAAKKRWDRDASAAERSSRIQMLTDDAIESEIENENDNEIENEKDKNIKIKKEGCDVDMCTTGSHTTSPPSLDDVISFCKQENLTAIDPQRFWNYNSAVGWVMCGKPIHDWKAAVRIWNTKDQEAEVKPKLDFRKYGTVL
jgi:hypothetical protein